VSVRVRGFGGKWRSERESTRLLPDDGSAGECEELFEYSFLNVVAIAS